MLAWNENFDDRQLSPVVYLVVIEIQMDSAKLVHHPYLAEKSLRYESIEAAEINIECSACS